MTWLFGWRWIPHAVGAVAVAALLGWCALDQRDRGRSEERAAQQERAAETETRIREMQDENAADAASGDARDRLRDGAASFPAGGGVPAGDDD